MSGDKASIPHDDLFAVASSSTKDRELGPVARRDGALELRELGDAVARRTRSLIAPAPILELEADKSKRDLDLSRHDLRMTECEAANSVTLSSIAHGIPGTGLPLRTAITA